jgi:hypothetical protein
VSEKQKAKHIADSEARQNAGIVAVYGDPTKSELDAAPSSPDGLGAWQGGVVRGALSGLKAKPQRTGDAKNTPGIDYASKITHRQDRDFNEVRVIENGDVMLYNVKTNAWDIKGDAADVPHYFDENDKEWAFNFKTAEWDVPIVVEEADITPCDDNSTMR